MKAGRQDLIGFDKNCLIRPRKFASKAGGHPHKGEPARAGANNNRTYKGNHGADSRSAAGKNKKPVKKKTIRNIHKKK